MVVCKYSEADNTLRITLRDHYGNLKVVDSELASIYLSETGELVSIVFKDPRRILSLMLQAYFEG